MRRLLLKHGVAASVATAALAGCADHNHGASAFHRVGVAANGFAAVTGNTTPGANFGLTVIRRK